MDKNLRNTHVRFKREIKIHVYSKRQRELVPREQVFPLFSVYSLLLLRKNK